MKTLACWIVGLALLAYPVFLVGGEAMKVDAAAIAAGKVEIVGRLGVPLGRLCTVEASVEDGSHTRMKALDGVVLLRVTKVNDKVLAKPVTFRFSEYESGTLTSREHGATYRGLVYETGGFSGIPSEAFAHVPAAATTGFHFDTALVVLTQHR